MRLFVAVNFDDAVRAAIREAVGAFPVANPPWRWADPSTWHVTLKFLGEISAGDVHRIVRGIEPVGARIGAFDLAPGRFGAFPSLRSPRVLFYGLSRGANECADLAGGVDEALFEAIGLARETRPFHAHATVARVKERLAPAIVSRISAVPAPAPVSTRVTSFELMESRLARTGATYSVVHRFPLA